MFAGDCSYLHARDPSVDRRFRPCPKRQVRLDTLIDELNESSSSSFSEDEEYSTTSTVPSSSAPETASVYLRLRPIPNETLVNESKYYNIKNNIFSIQCSDTFNNTTVSDKKYTTEKKYTFSHIFLENDHQKKIYHTSIKNIIDNEENGVILTYGTSGSGKTFTLLGDQIAPGIIPRAVEHLFTKYKDNIQSYPVVKIKNGQLINLDDKTIIQEEKVRKALINTSPGFTYNYETIKQTIEMEENFTNDHAPNSAVYIWVSFLEIYNERVYDLLDINAFDSKTKRKELKIISNGGHTFVKNLTSVYALSGQDVIDLLNYGLKHVSYATTNINTNSSRSHCILIIDVITFSPPNEFECITYKFGDLAGSERLKKTGNAGKRLKEAQHINTSLMVLGRCLDVLQSNHNKKISDIVPFRDSKLTLLLQAALQGKEKMTMIVNMLPIMDYFEENLNVLNFSSLAKELIQKPVMEIKKSRVTRYSFLFAQTITSPSKTHNDSMLLDEIHRLKTKMEMLTEQNNALVLENENLVVQNNDLFSENEFLTDKINTMRIEFNRKENEMREKLCSTFAEEKLQKEKFYTEIMNEKVNLYTKHYEKKLEFAKEKYEKDLKKMDAELEAADMEIEELKNKLGKNHNRRKTID